MAYKKPVVVAKAEAKKSYVAGCPSNVPYAGCYANNRNCMAGALN